MPRRELLTSAQRAQLLAFPVDEGELIRHTACRNRTLRSCGSIEVTITDSG